MQKCEREELVPRRFRYHLGHVLPLPDVRHLPRGAAESSRTRSTAKHGGFLNMLERVLGQGKLFHCRWCRLQFYDRRPLAPKSRKPPTEPGRSTVAVRKSQHTADRRRQ